MYASASTFHDIKHHRIARTLLDLCRERARRGRRGASDPVIRWEPVVADLELFENWRAGDRQAGQELFVRHFQGVYRFFKHKIDRRLEITADDLAQQTFFQCIRARDQFRHTSSFRTYLFAIARNELYQYLRKL